MDILILILLILMIVYWKKISKKVKTNKRQKYIRKQVKKAIRSIKDGQEHIGLNIELRKGGKV